MNDNPRPLHHHGHIVRDVLRHDAAGTDFYIISYMDRADNLGPGPNEDIVPDDRRPPFPPPMVT